MTDGSAQRGRRSIWISRLATAALVAAAALGAAGCARNGAAGTASAAGSVDDRASSVASDDAYSLYDLTSTWKDSHGTTRSLASLGGRPVALAMIYTHCGASCPLTLMEMKRIEASTDSRVALVFVSLDPSRDTPTELAEYAREHGLSADRWTLLSGTDDTIRELAAALGVRYRQLSTDEIAHSNLVTLLDAHGKVAAQSAGPEGAERIIAAAHALTR